MHIAAAQMTGGERAGWGMRIAAVACVTLVGLLGLKPAGAQPAASASPFREDVASLLAPGADLTQFANEDAVYLFAGDTIVLHADGRIDRGMHRVVRLNSELAIDEFGDARVPYDTLRQELVVHACCTYTPDGQIVSSSGHAFNRVTPDVVAPCPDALCHQEMVLSHLGVERGCVIELDVEVRDKVAHAPWLEGIAFLRMNYPVARRVVTVKVPAGVTLEAQLVNGTAELSEIDGRGDAGDDGAARIHVWRAQDLPAARESDDGAGGRLARAHLLYSTCPSWERLAERVRADLTAGAECTPALVTWLESARRDPTIVTPLDEARAIAGLCAEQVRDISIEPFENYHAPQSADRTFESCCGDAWDKSALALALLQAAGLEAEPMLRPVSPQPQKEIASLSQFDRVLLRVTPRALTGAGVTPITVDPVSGSVYRYPQEWGGQPLCTLGARGAAAGAWVDGLERQARHGAADISVALTLADDGTVTGSAELALAGELLPAASGADIDGFGQDYAKRLAPGAEVTGATVTRLDGAAGELQFELKAPAFGEARGAYRHLMLPGGPRDIAGIVAAFGPHRAERSTAMYLPGTLSESLRWRIRLPQEVKLVHVPPAASLENGVGRFHAFTRVSEVSAGPPGDDAGQMLEIERTLELSVADIAPERYDEFRRLLETYLAENGRLVILMEKGADADTADAPGK
jgi:hypothetical protein